jgi:sigma-54 specific flagellar transcriptional regulator A
VRELGNLIERLSIQCQMRSVSVADLPPRYRPADWTPETQVPGETLIATVAATSLLAPALEALANSVADMPLDSEPEAELDAALEPQFADALLQEIPIGFDLRQYLESLEQRLIGRAMESSGGTVAQAARVLGLRRTTLVEKLRKYAMGGGEAVAPET